LTRRFVADSGEARASADSPAESARGLNRGGGKRRDSPFTAALSAATFGAGAVGKADLEAESDFAASVFAVFDGGSWSGRRIACDGRIACGKAGGQEGCG